MERHLDNLEGRNTSHPSTPPRGQSVDNVDYSTMVDEATAIKMIKEEEEMVRSGERSFFQAQRHALETTLLFAVFGFLFCFCFSFVC